MFYQCINEYDNMHSEIQTFDYSGSNHMLKGKTTLQKFGSVFDSIFFILLIIISIPMLSNPDRTVFLSRPFNKVSFIIAWVFLIFLLILIYSADFPYKHLIKLIITVVVDILLTTSIVLFLLQIYNKPIIHSKNSMQGKGVPIGTSNKLSNQQKIYQSQISNNQQNALYQPQTPIKTNNQSQQTQTLTGIYSLKDFNGEQGHNSNNNHIPKTGGQQLGGTISASSEEKTIRAAHLKLGQSN